MNTTNPITASKNPAEVLIPVNIPITTLISVSIAIAFILPPNSENSLFTSGFDISIFSIKTIYLLE